MTLCAPCSSIDFDRCFFGKEYHGIAIANSLGRVGHIIKNREKCRMCSLIHYMLENFHSTALKPENHNFICTWYDKSTTDDAFKHLAIQVSYFGFSCNLVDVSENPAPMRARLLPDTPQPDSQGTLIRDWLSTCKKGHQQCRHVWSTKTPADLQLRFIDVRNWCLVSAGTDSAYAALSYVWGASATVQTTKSNLAEHSVPGKLKNVGLPATIASAIALVDAIGLRYLWVDALCIVQDDRDDKVHQIQNMDSVYSNAEFTVVQATGDNSALPLLGFSTPTSKQQIVRDIKPGITVAVQWPGFDADQQASSKWVRRAWTFQEAILSPRMLIWHNGCVTWECRQAVWCEDMVPGSTSSYIKPQFGSRMLPVDPNNPTTESAAYGLAINPSSIDDSLSTYENAVKEYTGREMSFWSDKINAFTGIGAVFERNMKTKLHFGLPKNSIDTALLWSAEESLERLPEFPSWSWAGWKGKARYANLQPLFIAPMPAFYIPETLMSENPQTKTATVTRLMQDWEDENYVGPVRPWRISTKVAKEHRKITDKPTSRRFDDVPENANLNQCVFFQTPSKAASLFRFQDRKVISTESNATVGGIILDDPKLVGDDLSKMELVFLSTCSASTSKHTNESLEIEEYFPDHMWTKDLPQIVHRENFSLPLTCCRFLLVETSDSGVSQRRGMGEMSLKAFNRAGFKWKWVFLQ